MLLELRDDSSPLFADLFYKTIGIHRESVIYFALLQSGKVSVSDCYSLSLVNVLKLGKEHDDEPNKQRD